MSAQPPLVSIVITCYNDDAFLAEAIESALAQTYPSVETIVVDDGSTDASAEIAMSYGERVTLRQKQNGGLSSARNFGILAAHGDYVTFLDADDVLLSDFAAKTAPLLDADPSISWIYTQIQYFGRDTRVSQFPEFNVPRLKIGNYLRATALLRADVLQLVQFDESLRTGWEDWDFFLSLVELGFRGRLLDEPLMLYRKHPEADRMSDVMEARRNKRRVHRYIMRRHLKVFGWSHYIRFIVGIDAIRRAAYKAKMSMKEGDSDAAHWAG